MTADRKNRHRDRPSLEIENHLWSGGIQYVAGLDEAGRGCWAGPVFAAAVILPVDKMILNDLNGVRDSKKMTILQRTRWAEEIKKHAISYGVGFSTHAEIDKAGIIASTRQAMLRALACLSTQPQFLLLDYMLLPTLDLPQMSLVKGDVQVLSIAAASVLAKTSRDQFMREMDQLYPDYGFARHKGYGTLQHRQSLNRMGISAIHRRSFAPIRLMQESEKQG
jgi:ribonuclease HII